jgi:hypothetical protein
VDARAPKSPQARPILETLARVLLESKDPARAEEAGRLMQRSAAIAEALESLPRSPGGASDSQQVARPEVLFLTPGQNTEVKGDESRVLLVLVSSVPLTRYRLWINGRPFGDPAGFEVPALDEKDQSAEKGRILDKGRVLVKGEDRQALAKELPAAVAERVNLPRNRYFLQLTHTLPLEVTDGANLQSAFSTAPC